MVRHDLSALTIADRHGLIETLLQTVGRFEDDPDIAPWKNDRRFRSLVSREVATVAKNEKLVKVRGCSCDHAEEMGHIPFCGFMKQSQ